MELAFFGAVTSVAALFDYERKKKMEEEIILASGKVKEKYVNAQNRRAWIMLLLGIAIVFIGIRKEIYAFIAIGIFPLLGSLIIFLTIPAIKRLAITVTPERVYGIYGLSATEINLPVDSINGITNIKNGFIVHTSSTNISLCNIGNQDKILQEINKLISNRSRLSQQKTTIVQQSNADELKKYKDLLDQGIITQEEFDAKKKQLLGL